DVPAFINHQSTHQIYPLSLHDALPIYQRVAEGAPDRVVAQDVVLEVDVPARRADRLDPGLEGVRPVELEGQRVARHRLGAARPRSEEHTSELQSRENLVCRLLLEKKNY